jgi:signal transduction histidine kinase
VEATFQDGKPHQTEEVVTSQYGEQYNVLTWTAALRDANGEINQVMEMSTNITQIRKLQSHLTSLGLLLGSMSHGVRGVLTALDGGLYRLESGLKKGNQEQIEDALEVVKSMINRIRSMILDILYYTKERTLNWARVNVMDFSSQVAAVVAPKAEKHNLEFVYDYDISEVFFEIDPGTVSSALVNILENSIDACLDDKSTDKSHRVIFRVKENKNHIIFEANDNGVGMDEETRDKLFTLFFSSKGYRGTGLGLFIANQIVEQHGGSIEIDSELGKGSNFRIKLPKEMPKALKNGEKVEKEDLR